MARNMGADGKAVFRAVITITDRDTGKPEVKYEGPYTLAGAKGRVTFWENYLATYDDDGERTGSRASGHVEKAHSVWRPLDAEAPQPAEDPAADSGRRIPLDIPECPDTCPCHTTVVEPIQ
jgi:hypothetical protein